MKNVYRLLTFCGLLSVLFASRAQAQANFRPGYVLPLTGDTLRGEVDSREGRMNALRCRFRPAADGAVTAYLPAELRGYGFTTENKHYRSLPVAVGGAAVQPYFLEVLVDGPASLFFLRDAQQNEVYFVTSPKLPLTVLEHAMVQVVSGSQTYLEQQKLYRNTLSAALTDCPVVQAQLPRLVFQESALRKVVAKYNSECAGYQASRPQPHAATTHVALGLLVGGAQQNLTYSGFPYANEISTRRTHTGVAVGPVLQVSSSRVSQRLSLVVALLYEPEKYELEGEGSYSNSISGVHFRHRFDLAYLRLPVMVRYTYPRGKVAPFAEAGFTVAYAVKANATAEQLDNKGTYTPAQQQVAGATGNNFRAIQTALGAGLGLRTHVANGRALAFLVRAEAANGFSDASGMSTSVSHFYGLLSFDLTK